MKKYISANSELDGISALQACLDNINAAKTKIEQYKDTAGYQELYDRITEAVATGDEDLLDNIIEATETFSFAVNDAIDNLNEHIMVTLEQ